MDTSTHSPAHGSRERKGNQIQYVFEKLKARLVAGGHMQNKDLYKDLSASTVAISSIFALLSTAAMCRPSAAATDKRENMDAVAITQHPSNKFHMMVPPFLRRHDGYRQARERPSRLKTDKCTSMYFLGCTSIKIVLSSCFLLMKKENGCRFCVSVRLYGAIRYGTLVLLLLCSKLKSSPLLLPLHSFIYTAAILIQIYRLTTTPERLVVAKKSFLHAMALRAIVKPVAKVQDRTSVLCLYRSARTHCLYFAALYNVMRILYGWYQLHIQKLLRLLQSHYQGASTRDDYLRCGLTIKICSGGNKLSLSKECITRRWKVPITLYHSMLVVDNPNDIATFFLQSHRSADSQGVHGT